MIDVEERTHILKMIRNGELTADEGAQILRAMRTPGRAEEQPLPEREPTRHFRIRITDLDTGKQKVDYSLPLNMLKVGMRMGARLSREEIRLEDFTSAAESGITGKIGDMEDKEERERIEIFLE